MTLRGLLSRVDIFHFRLCNQIDLLAGTIEHFGRAHHLALLTIEFCVSASILVVELKGTILIRAIGIGDVEGIAFATKTTKIALIALLGTLISAELFVAWRIRERNRPTGLERYLEAFKKHGLPALAFRARAILSQLVAQEHVWDKSNKEERLKTFANLVATAFELESFPLTTRRHTYHARVT